MESNPIAADHGQPVIEPESLLHAAAPDQDSRLNQDSPDQDSASNALRGTEHAAFSRVLKETIEALEEQAISYALIGGIASTTLGRPRWTHDIDVLVKPQDADRALEALDARSFRTEKTDMSWLYKGFKQDVMVDVIFRSRGDIYLDEEMIERSVRGKFDGHSVRCISPEDLLIMKAVVHDEVGPRHWHDALAIIASGQIDWTYLQRRARRAPRRILSLLIYAHSQDQNVPNEVIRELYREVYES